MILDKKGKKSAVEKCRQARRFSRFSTSSPQTSIKIDFCFFRFQILEEVYDK